MKDNDRTTRMQWLQAMVLGAGISLFILITLGGIAASPLGANWSAEPLLNMGLQSSCPDWPTCFGSWSPPENPGALVDYAHRLSALAAAPFLAALALDRALVFPAKPADHQGCSARQFSLCYPDRLGRLDIHKSCFFVTRLAECGSLSAIFGEPERHTSCSNSIFCSEYF